MLEDDHFISYFLFIEVRLLLFLPYLSFPSSSSSFFSSPSLDRFTACRSQDNQSLA